MPNGASVRRTKRGRISIKRSGAVYTLKRSGYKCCSMFSLVVYSLDSNLRWYLDGTEIEFPKGGFVVDSENKEARCSGFIFGIGLFLIIFVLSYLMVQYPDMVADSQAKKIAKSLSSIQSRINVQPTTISLSLPTDSFVYDAQGGGVIGDSLMSFNEGSHDLSFHVSYPNGSEQKSLEVRLSGARVGATYTLIYAHEGNEG